MQSLKWLGVELVEVSLKEKFVSVAGATLAIYLVSIISHMVLPTSSAVGVVASMGATAVLLFAVPHGQLSQPWPLLGGHFVSALVGVSCAQAMGSTFLATAIAVGVSIGLMQQLKCIHPPGGATAFTAVMGGQAIQELGFLYVLIPVGLNAVAMMTLAIAINYPFSWRRYPAAWIKRMANSIQDTLVISDDEHRRFVEAVRSIDSFVDVSEEDLVYLTRTMMQFTQSRGE
jgi:CBS domain-containing membrane protein